MPATEVEMVSLRLINPVVVVNGIPEIKNKDSLM